MSNHDTNFGFLDYGRGRRCDGRVLTIVAVSLTVASGCGFSGDAPRAGASVDIIQGKDSAGATIELEKRGDDLTRARVIDVVLGTGEGEIISDGGGIEFTIDFPAGAAITYRGQSTNAGAAEVAGISGTWHQHPDGVFGADSGTWQAASPTADSS